MTSDSSVLARDVRRKLDAGTPAEDVIKELLARGLSPATAERFVDHAVAERAASPSAPHERSAPLDPEAEARSIANFVSHPDAAARSQAYLDLTGGAIGTIGGLVMAMLWFTTPGRGIFYYSVTIVGVFFFVRGLRRCADLPDGFPWIAVLANAAAPAVLLVLLVTAVVRPALQRENAARAAAAAELAAADRSRAEQVRVESEAQRAVADAERSQRRDERLARALSQLSSDHPMTQCEAAQSLGGSGATQYAPALVALLSQSSSTSVQVCAAAALVQLGETAPALAVYAQWVRGDDPELRRSALMGFGDVGPSAASIALPFLTEDVKSPDWAARYLAVESLAKLGPEAVPLLEVASGDADHRVRARAADALRANRSGR